MKPKRDFCQQSGDHVTHSMIETSEAEDHSSYNSLDRVSSPHERYSKKLIYICVCHNERITAKGRLFWSETFTRTL